MIAYVNGVIKAIDKKGFDNQEGERIEYNSILLQSRDEKGLTETEQINSKQDFSKFVDEPVTVTLSLRPDRDNPKLKKVSILEVVALNEQ